MHNFTLAKKDIISKKTSINFDELMNILGKYTEVSIKCISVHIDTMHVTQLLFVNSKRVYNIIYVNKLLE